MEKETMTQRVKGLLFANAEAERLMELNLKYCPPEDDFGRKDLKRRINDCRQKVWVLREVLGDRVGAKVEAQGWWSATERFAKEHKLDKYVIAM